MTKRKLGNTDLNIVPIVFGGNVFGWTIDQQQSFKVLMQSTLQTSIRFGLQAIKVVNPRPLLVNG